MTRRKLTITLELDPKRTGKPTGREVRDWVERLRDEQQEVA